VSFINKNKEQVSGYNGYRRATLRRSSFAHAVFDEIVSCDVKLKISVEYCAVRDLEPLTDVLWSSCVFAPLFFKALLHKSGSFRVDCFVTIVEMVHV